MYIYPGHPRDLAADCQRAVSSLDRDQTFPQTLAPDLNPRIENDDAAITLPTTHIMNNGKAICSISSISHRAQIRKTHGLDVGETAK